MTNETNNKNLIAFLEQRARAIRATCVQMAVDGKHGHLSSALSMVDVLVALFHVFLNIKPGNLKDPEQRDRFILSKGHGCTSLYAVMADTGLIDKRELSQYATEGATLQCHPCKHLLPLLECSSGSLGQGFSMASGMAHGLKLKDSQSRVVSIIGDGECNEGSVWETAMYASANNLNNLIAIVDNNKVQAVGRSDQLMGFTSLAEKFTAFGWQTTEINGNSMADTVQAMAGYSGDRPTAFITNTIGGAGIDFMEDDVLWHYRVPSREELAAALKQLATTPIHHD